MTTKIVLTKINRNLSPFDLGLGHGLAQGVVEAVVPGRIQSVEHTTGAVHIVVAEEHRDDPSVVGDLLHQVIVVAGVCQGLGAHIQDLLGGQSAPAQVAPQAEKFAEVIIWAQAGLAQIDIEGIGHTLISEQAF